MAQDLLPSLDLAKHIKALGQASELMEGENQNVWTGSWLMAKIRPGLYAQLCL